MSDFGKNYGEHNQHHVVNVTWGIISGARAADLLKVLKPMVKDSCAEGDPWSFQGSPSSTCAVKDIRRIKSAARQSENLDRFEYEDNYAHFKLDFIEVAHFCLHFLRALSPFRDLEKD